ncbi:HNH endonuclease [Flavobacterium salilacus subsp. salilacus]|uniref:HNH endonuclease signature motif containing protein n=1 Tax=Flavobacterium TaxID=237 RepID=UPI001074F5F2|nr:MULTISPECIES: HNH endonuclease [Flavobacterium]KAF2518830.1 HNH endonuclease [Flavobacterium salilacus subsp. salilacus]MBE1615011.1 HNH endonuclease [Flavobacterium sp. SaA2.13]
MLRLYRPIEHDIFKLHTILEHLVCNVWCEACDEACDSKLQNEFKALYVYSVKKGVTLKNEVERIYKIFQVIPIEDRALIKKAFEKNNDIERLCNGEIPIYLNELNDVISNDIKPLFKWCYEVLLNKEKVVGDKMDYYKALIKHNNFHVCPCCGLIDIESFESKYREAFDHYLPKSKYPFASVNFRNLVPLCYKCNSDRKKARDPIENERVVFYPFSQEDHSIEICSEFLLSNNDETLETELEDFKIDFIGNSDKIDTWKWLFDIEERYGSQMKRFATSFLGHIRRLHNQFVSLNPNWTYLETIDFLINDYKNDYFDDKKFLKIAFLKAVKKDNAFLQTSA